MSSKPSTDQSPTDSLSAYLVFRKGERWTDVYRLVADLPVTIGRSRHSQVMIRSDQCSRAHAQIRNVYGEWRISDLGSRNGTFVGGERVQGERQLYFGETIEIAGCQMTLVSQVAEAFHLDNLGRDPIQAGKPVEDSAEGGDFRTLEEIEIEAAVITERRRRTPFLEPLRATAATPPLQSLFRIAFDLARAQTPEAAASLALAALKSVCGVGSGAVLMLANRSGGSDRLPSTAAGMTALATINRGGRSYRRLPDRIAGAVLESGEAILARNIASDTALMSPDSRGNLTTTSALCVPVQFLGKTAGLLHLYSADEEKELGIGDLEYAMAVSANLGLALDHLYRESLLDHKLKSAQRQLVHLQRQLGEEQRLVGKSPEIQEIHRQIELAGPTNVTILVRGESGVGKELVAAAIHQASNRREGPLVCLNCAALAPSLLESELFGHEKGAFTGATERKMGKFEAADGGTLMLDEIGEMTPEIQAKFLRVLEGHPFERIGGNQPIRVDVRVIAATNRDLEQAVREGQFRSDLYFRLHVIQLNIPPLRERGGDVLLIAEYFLEKFAKEVGRRIQGFTQAAGKKLVNYRWPGNIRELKNTIERAVVLSAGPLIDAEDLFLSTLEFPGTTDREGGLGADRCVSESRLASSRGNVAVSPFGTGESPRETVPPCADGGLPGNVGFPRDVEKSGIAGSLASLAELEREHILNVIRVTGGNKSQAAKILGIERSTLDRKLKRLES